MESEAARDSNERFDRLEMNERRLQQLTVNETRLPEYKKSSLPTTEFFDPNWLSLIKLYQNNLLPVQVIAKKETQQWFQYFPNQDNPAES